MKNEFLNEVKVVTVHRYLLKNNQPILMNTPAIVLETFKQFCMISDWWTPDKEVFIQFLLDSKHRAMAFNLISLGLVDQALVAPLETLRVPVMLNSRVIVLAHTHPSGNPDPSKEDLAVTKTIISSASLLGIKVLDHVILTPCQTHTAQIFSMRESGMVQFDGDETTRQILKGLK